MVEQKIQFRPTVLCILDGWGLAPRWSGNAIASAKPENFSRLWREFPHLVLQAGGYLETFQTRPDSEVLHTTIGAGRLIFPQGAEVTKAIQAGTFYQNKVLLEAIDFARQHRTALHLVQLTSAARVIADTRHLIELLRLASGRGAEKVYLHAILDGQDVPPTSGLVYLEYLQGVLAKIGIGKIISICGRRFALTENWQQLLTAYLTMTEGKGRRSISWVKFLRRFYQQGEIDANLPPVAIVDSSHHYPKINDQDVVIFLNFDGRSLAKLVRVFADPRLGGEVSVLKNRPLKNLYVVTLTDYGIDIPVKVAFPKKEIKNSLPEVLAHYQLRQLRAAEEVKKAHVTYFFDGEHPPYPGEDWLIVPSSPPAEWVKKPELEIETLMAELIPVVANYDFILVNFANLDLVAHTGDFLAVQKAVQAVDYQIGRLVNVVYKLGGAVILTADHGNAEQVIERGESFQQYRNTFNPVPFILIAPGKQRKTLTKTALVAWESIFGEMLTSEHNLADIAPTVLALLGLAQPPEMTGVSLVGRVK